jgi:hypothetical protein
MQQKGKVNFLCGMSHYMVMDACLTSVEYCSDEVTILLASFELYTHLFRCGICFITLVRVVFLFHNDVCEFNIHCCFYILYQLSWFFVVSNFFCWILV